MTDAVPMSADEFVVRQLDERLATVQQTFDADALCLVGGLFQGVDDLIRATVEDLRQRDGTLSPDERQTRLVVILTTNGGYIETVQRIVETLRHHYGHVGFIIPNYAFSAGTVLAMSGDEIYMDYYSRLGPIDPQVLNDRNRWVPALGYLIQWDRLLKKAADGELTLAEAQLMIEGFDQAALYQYEQARELSVTLLEEWLAKYKFKNWVRTETRKRRVTDAKRKARAKAIAKLLSATEEWHSHGTGISMEVLRRKLNLVIDDLEDNPAQWAGIRQYDSLLSDYMTKRGHLGVLHTVGRYLPFM
ncbi:MAG: serine dehydrogenasease [Chloroflexota bacterium]|nr:serine dehydrogenasease [Chloroflexota bacterium]